MMAPMLLAAAAAVALVTLQTKTDPDLGIAEALAQARRARISNLRYDLAFTIPVEKSKPVWPDRIPSALSNWTFSTNSA